MSPNRFPCPPTSCPYCFKPKGDGVVAVTPNAQLRPPIAGDISVCSCCGNWAVFSASLQLVEPDEMQKMIIEKSGLWPMIQGKCEAIRRRRRTVATR